MRAALAVVADVALLGAGIAFGVLLAVMTLALLAPVQ